MHDSSLQPHSSDVSISTRATAWQLRTRSLELPLRPLVMGIVNVTPDSFSDGGKFLSRDHAIEHGLLLAAQGADVLDIGGESTRPYSDPVDAAEELGRTQEVVRELARRVAIPISIDTSKAAVAQAALEAGAEIVNDVTALTGDPAMPELVRHSKAGVVLMHMQGTPQTMQDAPVYQDVVGEVRGYLRARRDAVVAQGVDQQRICLDPGIGFGKTHQHNLILAAECWRLHELGCPLLVGHSRKGFIAKVLGDKEADRTAGTIGVALALARQQVQLIRVHDVEPVRQALWLFDACGGIDGQAKQLGN